MVPLPRRALAISTPILAAVAIAGCDTDTEDPTIGATYELPASARSLEVDGQVGEVTVTAKQGQAKIGVVEKRTESAKPTHAMSGSTATLKYDCGGGDVDVDTCRVDYEITIPARVAVTVNNSAGRISGTGLGPAPFTASTDAGEIDLAFASAPSLVKTTAQAGETTITLPAGEAYAVSASSSVGDTSVDVQNDPSARSRVEAKAEVGGITIKEG